MYCHLASQRTQPDWMFAFVEGAHLHLGKDMVV